MKKKMLKKNNNSNIMYINRFRSTCNFVFTSSSTKCL